jgi:hypothetical protein
MHWLRNFVATKARRLLRVLLLWFRAMPADSAIGREEMLLIGGGSQLGLVHTSRDQQDARR